MSQVLLNTGLEEGETKERVWKWNVLEKEYSSKGSVEDAAVILQFLIDRVLWFLYSTALH